MLIFFECSINSFLTWIFPLLLITNCCKRKSSKESGLDPMTGANSTDLGMGRKAEIIELENERRNERENERRTTKKTKRKKGDDGGGDGGAGSAEPPRSAEPVKKQLREPHVVPWNEKEQKIAAGARVGSRDYPTFDECISDWTDDDTKKKKPKEKTEPVSTEKDKTKSSDVTEAL